MVKILIAEDDRVSHEYLKEILNDGQVEFVGVNNGKDAVEKCKYDPAIDIVLMDIKMPYLDGRSAMKQIKSLRPDLPIIAQTAYALDNEKEKILQDGFDAYFSKPIRRAEIVEKINELLKK